MGVVRLHRVISFSCHDAKHQVKNLLCYSGPNPSGYWLSSPLHKTGRIEAEFQLEEPSYIHYVDIGNCWSSTVEIYVRLSTSPKSNGYICLLPAVQMMTPSDYKNGLHSNRVEMFVPENMNPEAINEKWDRVKVVCTQNFCKDKQFGLAFLCLKSRESNDVQTTKQSVHFDFENGLKSPVPVRKKISSPSPRSTKSNSLGMTRARNLVKAAQRKQLMMASKTPKRALFQEDYDFETDALCFLTSIPSSALQLYNHSTDACIDEFEQLRERKLNKEEKESFRRALLGLLSVEDDDASPITSSPVSSKRFYSLSPRKGIRENGHHKGTTTSPSRIPNGDDISFDVDFKHPETSKSSPSRDADTSSVRTVMSSTPTEQSVSPRSLPNGTTELSPEKRPKRKKKYITMKDMSRSPIKQRRMSVAVVRNTPKQGNAVTPHNDFIQPDGSVPSTSREITYIDCPICDEPFHISEIESHAATCGDLLANTNLPSNREDEDDDVTVISQFPSRKEAAAATASSPSTRSSSVSCHSDNFVECPVCGDMFKQTVVQNHTNMCIENCIA